MLVEITLTIKMTKIFTRIMITTITTVMLMLISH